MESSLGYFITPLLNVLMGRLLLGETLSRAQGAAVALAVVGVSASVLAYGHIPWIGLTLAFSFAFYGYVQKTLRMPSAPSLFVQALMLMPLSLLCSASRNRASASSATAPCVRFCSPAPSPSPVCRCSCSATRPAASPLPP